MSNVPTRVELLGVPVDAMTLSQFMAVISSAVDEKRPTTILNVNVHGLALAHQDPGFRSTFELADVVFVDGMLIVSLAKLLGLPVRSEHRLAVLDWIWPLFAHAASDDWHIVHLGSTDQVLAQAAQVIKERIPDLRLTLIPGYFDATRGSDGNAAVLQQICSSPPDVLLVGMGMPRQEEWVADNLAALPPCVVITVGGILGFLGGERRIPPRWLGRLRLEWAFRLVTEPQRLWRRYLIEPVVLLRPLSVDLRRRYGLRRDRA
ncbi:MAG: WecB/TagA/CpsF family glycosyltransferase [Acidimicrobiales bacterium]